MAHNQQAFIQILMHNGIVSESLMKQLCKKIFGEENQQVEYHVAKVNRSVEELGMGIKSAICELTGQKYWLFTSTIISELENFNYDHKPFLEFTKVELKFLSKIFSEIINSNEGYISSINCINFADEMEPSFSPSHADEYIKKMIDRMWLCTNNGRIYLGVRSIAEFMPLFKSKFKDELENCFLCKQTVFFGRNCDNCNIKFHIYCLAKVLKINSNVKCLNCKNFLNVENISVNESCTNIEDQPVSQSTSKKRNSQIR